jgi:23S rRNA (uracil1939-C5)-methyltransferase
MSRRRSAKKRLPQEPVRATVETLSHDGNGVARIEGKATFIQGALPNEVINFLYTEKKKHYDKGYCTEVLSPSPLRAKPKCVHYEICGGCALQHLKSEEQIKEKSLALISHLKHIGETEAGEVLAPLKAKKWGYRHKARLSVRYVEKKEKILVGFRERLSGRFIADIEQCEVLHPAIGLLISPLKKMIRELNNYREIAQIEVAISEEQNALILRHLSPFTDNDKTILSDFAKTHDITWYLQSGGPQTVQPLNDSEPLLFYTLPNWDLTLYFKPTDFTQINPSINAKMISLAIELLALNKDETVLDLFCGLGNFSLPIAGFSKQVTGVEGSDEMVQRATMNAEKNNIENTDFHQADLFEDISAYQWANKQYNKILLDPPRAGALALCQQIERFAAKKIVYVSCSPQTLARDTRVLVHEKGYRLISTGVLDMFPHTAHVESIALFEKKG